MANSKRFSKLLCGSLLCGSLLCASLANVSRADDGPASAKKSASTKKFVAIASAESRAAVPLETKSAEVMSFLKTHHAELAALLGHLATNKPKDFEKAIHDLYRSQQQLEGIKQRDQARYDLALQDWVIQSRIQLVVAKLSMMDSEPLRAELKSLLSERIDSRLAVLRADQQRSAERLKKYTAQIEKLEQGRAESVARQFAMLIRNGKSAAPSAAAKKPKPREKTSPTAKP